MISELENELPSDLDTNECLAILQHHGLRYRPVPNVIKLFSVGNLDVGISPEI